MWGSPMGCGGLSDRPAMDGGYRSALATRHAVTGLFSMYPWIRWNPLSEGDAQRLAQGAAKGDRVLQPRAA
jgi:hypothetical protein